MKGFAKRCSFHWPLEKRGEVLGGEDFRTITRTMAHSIGVLELNSPLQLP